MTATDPPPASPSSAPASPASAPPSRSAEDGIDHVVLERADDVGGTWRDNTYPGCRCDVPSHLYSFSFAPNPEWTETYSPQPEIRAYLRRTAEEHGVSTASASATRCATPRWDDEAAPLAARHRGRARSPPTSRARATARWPSPRSPTCPGIESFTGHDVPLGDAGATTTTSPASGWRSSAPGRRPSSSCPRSSRVVEHLTVFQRTAPWVLPHSNRRITDVERALYRRVPRRCSGSCGACVYWRRELFVPAACSATARRSSGLEGLAQRHLARQVPRPRAAARRHPRLPARVQAAAAVRRLVPGAPAAQRRRRHREGRRGPPARRGHRRRRRARGRHHHLRHRLPRDRQPGGRAACTASTGAAWPSTGRRRARRPTSARRCPASRTCSCWPGPTPASATRRWWS